MTEYRYDICPSIPMAGITLIILIASRGSNSISSSYAVMVVEVNFISMRMRVTNNAKISVLLRINGKSFPKEIFRLRKSLFTHELTLKWLRDRKLDASSFS